jgi:protein-disulfide isomerase
MRRSSLVPIALACAALACAKGAASPSVGGATKTAAAQAASAPTPVHDSIVDAADRGRILGKESAPVWFLIVSDFQCPYCKAWHDSTFHALEKEYVATGKIRMAYVNYPMPQHANAIPAAVTAMCASAQGRFWATQDRIFDTQKSWQALKDARPYLDSLAVTSGADAAKLRSCEDDKRMLPLIALDQSRFQGQGVQGTPTFFIGSAQLVGALPTTEFRHVIDSVLAVANKGR